MSVMRCVRCAALLLPMSLLSIVTPAAASTAVEIAADAHHETGTGAKHPMPVHMMESDTAPAAAPMHRVNSSDGASHSTHAAELPMLADSDGKTGAKHSMPMHMMESDTAPAAAPMHRVDSSDGASHSTHAAELPMPADSDGKTGAKHSMPMHMMESDTAPAAAPMHRVDSSDGASHSTHAAEHSMPMHMMESDTAPAAAPMHRVDSSDGASHSTHAAELPMPADSDGKTGAKHSMPMHMMDGGAAPAVVTTRSADYSAGVSHSTMPGMDMAGSALSLLRVNQLEGFHGPRGSGLRWDVEGWYGKDIDKLGWRSEGERQRGNLEDASVEVFWSHAVAPYWDTQLGMRQDFGEGPKRSWAAFGVQGLTPYWFELQATGYLDASGRTAARVRADYELLLTQRLILQPEMEVNLYGKSDPGRRLGAGLTDMQLGLRLRYEMHRRFAPYLGVNWARRLGATASYARQDHQPVSSWQLVGGVRFWF